MVESNGDSVKVPAYQGYLNLLNSSKSCAKPVDKNPVAEFFKEKVREYWGHVKGVLNFEFTKKIEDAKEQFTGDLPPNIYTNGIESERILVFSKLLPQIEKLLLEGLERLDPQVDLNLDGSASKLV